MKRGRRPLRMLTRVAGGETARPIIAKIRDPIGHSPWRRLPACRWSAADRGAPQPLLPRRWKEQISDQLDCLSHPRCGGEQGGPEAVQPLRSPDNAACGVQGKLILHHPRETHFQKPCIASHAFSNQHASNSVHALAQDGLQMAENVAALQRLGAEEGRRPLPDSLWMACPKRQIASVQHLAIAPRHHRGAICRWSARPTRIRRPVSCVRKICGSRCGSANADDLGGVLDRFA